MSLKNLWIATPSHDAKVHVDYTRSLIWTICKCMGRGITCHTDFIKGNADINSARNALVHSFLDSGFGAMLFIDSDLSWPPEAVFALLDSGKSVIGGVYPKKVPHEEYVVRPIAGTEGSRIMPVAGLGGGFLLIRREALLKFEAYHKDRQYKDPVTGKTRTVFFNGGLHSGRILSEDLDFCQACRDAGIDVFARTDITFGHSGNHVWSGSYAEHMNRKAQEASEKSEAAA